jgi:TIR domain
MRRSDLRDKVLLVLSERSIASDWVEDEVTKAYAEERRRGMTVLFPIRLDDTVFATNEAWALKLRDNRNIGDFRCWKEHDAYQKALDRLLCDLRIETG